MNELKGTWIKFPLKYAALDCGRWCSWENMSQVLPNLPKLWGNEYSSRVSTTNNIVKIMLRIQFECDLLKVWKDYGMASIESAPLATYRLSVH